MSTYYWDRYIKVQLHDTSNSGNKDIHLSLFHSICCKGNNKGSFLKLTNPKTEAEI